MLNKKRKGSQILEKIKKKIAKERKVIPDPIEVEAQRSGLQAEK